MIETTEQRLDPRRCADIEYISMRGNGVKCKCGHFWWDCGPKDELADHIEYYKEICCTATGDIERISMGVVKSTAIRGCCAWKPCFDEEQP